MLTFNGKFREVFESFEPGSEGGPAGKGGIGGLGGNTGFVNTGDLNIIVLS